MRPHQPKFWRGHIMWQKKFLRGHIVVEYKSSSNKIFVASSGLITKVRKFAPCKRGHINLILERSHYQAKSSREATLLLKIHLNNKTFVASSLQKFYSEKDFLKCGLLRLMWPLSTANPLTGFLSLWTSASLNQIFSYLPKLFGW